MGDFRVLGIIAILAAITYGYFVYIRPVFGENVSTALAVLVFFLLFALVVCRGVV